VLKLTGLRRRARIAVACLAIGVAAPLAAIAFSLPAAAAEPPSAPVSVLGPHGIVAQRGSPWWVNYAQWQLLDTGGQVPANCATTTVNGQRVSVIEHLAQKPGIVHVTCRVRADLPAVLIQPVAYCTTLPHDHGRFGTTPADLQRCARHAFTHAHLKVTTVLDGTTIDVAPHRAASPVQTATIPAKNAFNVTGGTRVRVASDGYILLVASLPAGRHTLSSSVRTHGKLYGATWVLNVS
jgi:hypothetical protein